jgi:hypothetical protein
MEDGAILYGRCSPWPARADLVAVLRAGGLAVSEGRYAVRVTACENFSFEHYGGDMEPGIQADAETLDRMLADAEIVSRALTLGNVRHGFEVYGPEGKLVGYYHHDWPREA